jgi:hypothetical protein
MYNYNLIKFKNRYETYYVFEQLVGVKQGEHVQEYNLLFRNYGNYYLRYSTITLNNTDQYQKNDLEILNFLNR